LQTHRFSTLEMPRRRRIERNSLQIRC
jgi:hypothetical protein